MRLQTLLSSLFSYELLNEKETEILHIEMDSRKVIPNTLFFCVKGYTVDGHDFAKQAIEKGAVALVVERILPFDVPQIVVRNVPRSMARMSDYFYGHPTQKLKLIGITGTNGKSSTTHIISEILELAKIKTGTIGTIQIKIGDEIKPVANTTPESITLQSTFHEMVEKEVNTAVIEVSSHALHLGRIHGCDFDIAVFTNLTQDHLDYHGTMEEYKKAKGLLFSQLGNSFSTTKKKFAVLNSDDEASKEFAIMTQAEVITYGIENDAYIRATDISITNHGTTFNVKIGKQLYNLKTKLIGKFNIYNILAAIGACLAQGISFDVIKTAIANLDGVPGRFETVPNKLNKIVIVDYAHTPDSLENVLKTVQEFVKGEVYCIVGCGGDRDRTKRPIMANIAVSNATHAIFTSDNPRSEDPSLILKDMEAGVHGETYTSIIDRKEAIHYAISKAKENDVIIIAGKGHETYQTIHGVNYDFDDRLVAKEALENEIK